MPVPANDAQADAETVTVGPYWGVVSGTTVEATEDAGGPFDGFDVQEVWYTWSSLPAGLVFFYVKPASESFLEFAVWSAAPGDVTDYADAILYTGGDDSDGFMALGQGTHAGGPMTMAVLTYVGSPGPIAFQFGWGHELDATASHWGEGQEDPWVEIQAGLGRADDYRGIFQTQSADQAGTTPVTLDQAVVDAAYANARMGVVHDLATGTGAPAYEGPGPGTNLSALNDLPADVGQYTRAINTQLFLPTRTQRSDRVGVNQTVLGARVLTDAHVEPFTEDDQTPDTFADYAEANGRPDGLVWGYDFQAAAWDLRNLEVHYNVTTTSTSDREDASDVRWRLIPESMLWDTAGTVDDEWNRVYLAETSIDASYVLPPDVGAEIAALDDGANVVVVADFAPDLLPDVDGVGRWFVGVLMDQQTIDDVPPDGIQDGSADSNRNVANVAIDRGGGIFWDALYEARLPSYLPYLGFPLIPPVLGGWHVGRAALSVSGPW